MKRLLYSFRYFKTLRYVSLLSLIVISIMSMISCSVYRSGGRQAFEGASQGNVNTELQSNQKIDAQADTETCWVQSKAEPLPQSGEYIIDLNHQEDTQLCPISKK